MTEASASRAGAIPGELAQQALAHVVLLLLRCCMASWAEYQARMLRQRHLLESMSSRELAVKAAIQRQPDIARHLARGLSSAHSPQRANLAIQHAKEEGLELVRSRNATGFAGVSIDELIEFCPYQAHVIRDGGRQQFLDNHFTAEEAALAYARALGPEASRAAAKEFAEEEVRRRMQKLRRHAIIVGKAASLLQTIYTEVTFRPGHQGQKRSREEFEAAAAAQHA